MNRKNVFTCCFGLALLLPTACTREGKSLDTPVAPQYIQVFTRGVATAESAAQLFFWEAEAYENFMKEKLPESIKPYLQVGMPDVINTYLYDKEKQSGTPYNTYTGYPGTNLYLYASGIAPAKAFYTPVTGDYDVIPVAENCRDGLTDFTASNNDGTSRGRAYNPFVWSVGERIIADGETTESTIDNPDRVAEHNEETELKFRHLTAVISFLGTRTKVMENKVGIRDVKVEIVNSRQPEGRKLAVPVSLKRFYIPDNKWTYIANPDGEIIPDVLEKTVEGVLVKGEEKALAAFYTHTAGLKYGTGADEFNPFEPVIVDETSKPSLLINVEADLFLVQDPKEVKHKRWENLKIDTWELGEGAYGTGDRFLPGHSYRVVIEFNLPSIALRAELIPWIEQGPYYFPVWGSNSSTAHH